MVRFGYKLFQREYSKDFVSRLRIYVKSGSSGRGNKFRGGVGGRGGNVYLVGSPNKNETLIQFKNQFPTKRFVAERGKDSSRAIISGLNGRDIFVPIPHGVSIIDATTNETIGEINSEKDKVLVATGEKGGNRFTDFAPKSAKGKSLWLDLQIMADVGFVGFPNAGKSTLLNAISKARPEIADYPFTTLRPHVGIVKYSDYRQIRCADIPGLIEGASFNEGMGHNFLRHIRRTNVLLFVVDVCGFSLSGKQWFRNPYETVYLLARELELFNKEYLKKPAIIALNKIDLPDSKMYLEKAMEELSNWDDNIKKETRRYDPKRSLKFKHIIPISAKHGIELEQLKHVMRNTVDGFDIKDYPENLSTGCFSQFLIKNNNKELVE